ncbi:hypothetical protein COU54_01425 [Candidatus Pacearchaeota archaeon CG10_big_fil_rev_8_21_14_0_10_31_24]|nr:MAG: hypothetical protein COU54_01425 [Candidatus Pacearchaeota archaeon CG10_big_fil_rev_8_21_14_0_10_31_24]
MNYSCAYCKYTSTKKSNIQAHELIHIEVKPFVCNICGFSTKQKGNLKTHMLRHSDKKPYKCNFKSCSFRTKRNSILQRHILTHLKEKKYKCDECLVFQTNSKAELFKHKCVHSKVDFNCKVCSFSTSYINVLANHMFKFHTNIPFNYPDWPLNARTVRWKDRLQKPIEKRKKHEQTHSRKTYHPLIYDPDPDYLSIMSVPELLDEIEVLY